MSTWSYSTGLPGLVGPDGAQRGRTGRVRPQSLNKDTTGEDDLEQVSSLFAGLLTLLSSKTSVSKVMVRSPTPVTTNFPLTVWDLGVLLDLDLRTPGASHLHSSKETIPNPLPISVHPEPYTPTLPRMSRSSVSFPSSTRVVPVPTPLLRLTRSGSTVPERRERKTGERH